MNQPKKENKENKPKRDEHPIFSVDPPTKENLIEFCLTVTGKEERRTAMRIMTGILIKNARYTAIDIVQEHPENVQDITRLISQIS